MLGSIHVGWVITRFLTGEDLRKNESGATGGTNVFRVLRDRLGLRKASFWSIVAVSCDLLKAFLPTRLAVKLWPDEHWLHVLVGWMATLGHTKPVTLSFQGGKAVSTSVGSFIAITGREPKLWHIFQLGIGVFTGSIATSKIVSLGSIAGSAIAGFYALRLAIHRQVSRWYGLSTLLTATYIIYLHRSNIKRMLKGGERRIRFW